MARAECPRSWLDLPSELIGLVLRHLIARVDRIRFAAVCPQWLCVAKEQHVPLLSPFLALSDGTLYSIPQSKPFCFPNCEGYDNTCDNWIVFSDDLDCFLIDPFRNATMKLPGIEHIIVRHDSAESIGERELSPFDDLMDITESDDVSLGKIVVCSTDVVIAHMRGGDFEQIAVCRPGASFWSVSAHDQCRFLKDMILYQGKLYAIDDNQDLLAITVTDSTSHPRVSRIERVIKGPEIYDRRSMGTLYLVESQGVLPMVLKNTTEDKKRALYKGKMRTIRTVGQSEFTVFRADLEQSQWTQVSSLGSDQVLFLRKSCSGALSVPGYEMTGDSIFFFDDHDGYPSMAGERSFLVYNMRDRSVSSPMPAVSWNRKKVAAWLFPTA